MPPASGVPRRANGEPWTLSMATLHIGARPQPRVARAQIEPKLQDRHVACPQVVLVWLVALQEVEGAPSGFDRVAQAERLQEQLNTRGRVSEIVSTLIQATI